MDAHPHRVHGYLRKKLFRLKDGLYGKRRKQSPILAQVNEYGQRHKGQVEEPGKEKTKRAEIMKNYLNKNDREHHLIILVVWERLNNWLKTQTALTPMEHKYLKTASTYLIKASDSIVARMDSNFAEKLKRDIQDSDFVIINKFDVSHSREFGYVSVKQDDLYDIASYALGECVNCQHCEDFENCERYKLFINLAIPVAQDKADSCPYLN